MQINKYININKLNNSLKNFNKGRPFPHVVIDNFLKNKIAKKIEKEFPNFTDKELHEYRNYCEIKKSTNLWNLFQPTTYQLISILNSSEFTNNIKKKLKMKNLYSDPGLNGGGLHIMGKGGKLNPHLDYVIHPKLNIKRKFNLIIFVTSNWKDKNGGEICFFGKNKKNKNIPGKMVKKIVPKFNRAILFDTSMYSWHSVSRILTKNIRKSIAAYYLILKNKNLENRKKALYSPLKNQIKNKKVKNFIKMRSNIKSYAKVFVT